jgi:hypothetical protein
MTAGLVPLAIVGLIGLALGLWMGMPGRDRQSVEDIEHAMEKGGGSRRRLNKRSINPFAWMRRKADAKPSRARRSSAGRRGFKLEAPDDRD